MYRSKAIWIISLLIPKATVILLIYFRHVTHIMLFSFLQYIYKLFLHHWVTFLANSNIINHNLTWKPKVCSCKYGCDYSWWDIEIPVCIFCWMRGPWINCSMTLRVTSNVCNNGFLKQSKFPRICNVTEILLSELQLNTWINMAQRIKIAQKEK